MNRDDPCNAIQLQELSLKTVRVAIVGASGYSGAELVSLLLSHPRVEIAGLFGSAKRDEKPQTLASIFSRFRGVADMPVRAGGHEAISDLRPDAVFLATPHEASAELAPELLRRGIVVFDLSAAFRLRSAADYPAHYGFEHRHPELLERAVYGLPELNRSRILRADLIAVPGCYPTSAILPLAPLVRAGAIARDSSGTPRRPVIDSTSGVSGAGRSLTLRNMFCEVSMQPYNVFRHRHTPEIGEHSGVPVVFTPHLGPYERGIVSTIHIELADGWSGARADQCLRDAYASEPFIRFCPAGVWPAAADVERTNFCDIASASEDAQSHLIIVSAIDNLVKGAAGQAVQCMNIRFGFPESASLLQCRSER